MTAPIPTNLVVGFLGAGKTTTIQSLLQRKPANEKWAVLVNEFGEVGIDGALLQGQGAVVREVPGGCMCCVTGVPMQIGLNMLIAKARPDRLLIEPTGLGHPSQILNLLRSDAYRDVLELRATLCLVDPRKLQDSRYTSHMTFRDQANLADVLVGNKADGLTGVQHELFESWAHGFTPPKAKFGLCEYGHIPLEWLDEALNTERSADDAEAHETFKSLVNTPTISLPTLPMEPPGNCWRRFENSGQGYRSCGWIISAETVFSYDALFSWCSGLSVTRLKAVVNTDQGWRSFNALEGVLTVTTITEAADSRLEVISGMPLDGIGLEGELQALQLRREPD